MKAAKIIAILLLAYAAFVAAFEARIGYVQFENPQTIILATTDADGTSSDRVIRKLESGGKLYVSAHHWPRAWYRRALRNPSVRVTANGVQTHYLAVPVTSDEYERVARDHPRTLPVRILQGFAPRRILRLDPA